MNVRSLILTLPATIVLALAGCAGSHASTREGANTAQTTQQGMQGMAAMCPMQVKGTKVEASNTDTGAALTFTTQGDVAELRRRVTSMAEMHNAHHGMAGGCNCAMHEGQGQGQGGSGCACGQHEGQGCNCPEHAGQGQACACGQHEGQGCNCPEHAGQGQACACGQHEGQTCPHCAMHGEHGKGMHGGMGMPASRVTTEEVPGGIRLVFTPEDPAQLDALRESVRAHADMMSSGQCPMMRSAPAQHGG